jgi:tRNA pseudouridine13 synthase
MTENIPGLDEAPFLTEGIRPVAGRIKTSPEDFRVDEVPLYPPSGRGEHLFVRIEKRSITTREALHRLGRALGTPPATLGVAGQKDARAVTTQIVSLPGVPEDRVKNLTLDGLRVLSVARHSNKLRVGHLKGNRFEIRYAGAGGANLAAAREVLSALQERGVPNAYMGQRFGIRGNTHVLGRALVRKDTSAFLDAFLCFDEADGAWGPQARRAVESNAFGEALDLTPPRAAVQRRVLKALAGGKSPHRARRAVPKRDLQLYLSAYQSFLFNQALARRLPGIECVEKGDLAFLHGKGAVFEVEDEAAEAERARRFEISPSGPVFGHKMRKPSGRWGEVERSIAAAEGLSAGDWKLGGGLSQKGARRPLRFPLEEASVEAEGEDLIFRFFLPKGCYATAVFREIGKGEAITGGDRKP